MTPFLRVKLVMLLGSAGWCALSQTSSGRALGSVAALKEPCKGGVGSIANTACRQLEVRCPGVKPIAVQVRITEPADGVPFRGTVVVGSGGGGGGFYAGQEGGRILVSEIAAMGFRVVDRAWDGGWPTAEGGLVKESCRYATLLTWIHDHIHTGGKFVATGNSGGSAEISYALTTWGRGDILDVAILTSGPPLGRLDYACVKQASPEWASLCASIVPKGVMECTPGCILGPNNGVCKQVSPNPARQQLLEDSVVHPGAVLNYPKTRVYFLYGARDCGEPVPIGLTYAAKVTSQKTIQFVPNTPHALFSTSEGREAMKKAIEDGTAGAGASLEGPTGPGGPAVAVRPGAPRLIQLRQKQRRGEPLTAEEEKYLAEVDERNRQYAREHPPRESTGMIALTDLGTGLYKGEQGGLYPGGLNTPPKAHLDAGVGISRQIVPLDAGGHRSRDGKIVLLSVGISNTTMESQTFAKLLAAAPGVNPHFVFVDGAQGGQAADQAANPNSNYWKIDDQRLKRAGLTRNQVQVLWIKETYPSPSQPFPAEAKKLKGYMVDILHVAHHRFPNLKIAYLSSRIYAGYSSGGANPEPFAYEFGFSVKWLIADQIAGKPELNFDPAKGPARSPWIAWGPYLWADGLKGRKDGLVWRRDDFAQDGMHPSESGREKVARMLLQFLKTDPTAKTWFASTDF